MYVSSLLSHPVEPLCKAALLLELFGLHGDLAVQESAGCGQPCRNDCRTANAIAIVRGGSTERVFRPVLLVRPFAVAGICDAIAIVAFVKIAGPQPIKVADQSVIVQSTRFGSDPDVQLLQLGRIRTGELTEGTPNLQQAAHRHHADICIVLGEKAWLSWYGHDEVWWLRRFSAANDDLRIALGWLRNNNPEQTVQLSGALRSPLP